MNCNKKCYWNFDNICVYEDEGKYDNGIPTNGIDCPNWLRDDFDEHFMNVFDNIRKLIRHRNISELELIEQFIIKQRSENDERYK